MEREKLFDKLHKTYFKKCYHFKNNPWNDEDEAFITDNVFMAIVTDKTKNNGYGNFLEEEYSNGVELNKPYTVVSMNVGQSSSDVILEEFPGKYFNTVNFEYYIANEK